MSKYDFPSILIRNTTQRREHTSYLIKLYKSTDSSARVTAFINILDHKNIIQVAHQNVFQHFGPTKFHLFSTFFPA